MEEHVEGTGSTSLAVEIDGMHIGLTFSASHYIDGHPTCGRLHGHNFSVSVRVKGEPGGQGIVVDFFLIEECIRQIIKDFDHKILVAVRHARPTGDHVSFETAEGSVQVPSTSVCLIDEHEVTSELLASYILRNLLDELKSDFPLVEEVQVGVGESEGRTGWAGISFR